MPATDEPPLDPPVAGRRQALKRLAVAGAGAAAGLAVVATRSAEAANGDPVLAGQTVDGTAPTTLRNTTVPAAQTEAPVALALAALGAQIRFLPPRALAGAGPADQIGPGAGVHTAGELLVDDEFSLWFSVPVGDGQLGWVKVAGRDTAGQFHPLPVPLRIYDSRRGQGPASTGAGPIAPGEERTIDLTVGYQGGSTTPVDAVPLAATAAALNITVVDTVGSGFLAVFSADQAYSGTSNINWSGPDQIVANYAVSATSLAGAVKVRAGGTGPTDLIIDVSGYYR